MEYSAIPANSLLSPVAFRASAPQDRLNQLSCLLSASSVGPETYENRQEDGSLGLSRAWLLSAIQTWRDQYDWCVCLRSEVTYTRLPSNTTSNYRRKTEDRINSFPNYTVLLQDEQGDSYNVHFLALFSTRADAVPIVLLHGWPGKVLCIYTSTHIYIYITFISEILLLTWHGSPHQEVF